jgi:hypothetical protein
MTEAASDTITGKTLRPISVPPVRTGFSILGPYPASPAKDASSVSRDMASLVAGYSER